MTKGYEDAFGRPASVDMSGDYPVPISEADGLSKREYFAAAALAGLLAVSDRPSITECATLAVRAADVLISKLNGETNDDD